MSKRAMILVRVSCMGSGTITARKASRKPAASMPTNWVWMCRKSIPRLLQVCGNSTKDLSLAPVLEAIRHRQTDAVVIHRINRATRAGGVHALVLAHECERNDVELHLVHGAVKGRVDITDTAGKIMLLIAGDQAYEERKSLLEAMARGRRTRVTNGRRCHRIAKFGYTWVDEHDPMTGKLVRKQKRAPRCVNLRP